MADSIERARFNYDPEGDDVVSLELYRRNGQECDVIDYNDNGTYDVTFDGDEILIVHEYELEFFNDEVYN